MSGSTDRHHPLFNCPACGGSGRVEPDVRCPVCNGNGWSELTCAGTGELRVGELLRDRAFPYWADDAKFLAECLGCSAYLCLAATEGCPDGI